MPSFPPRGLEPYTKKELLGKREQELRHALSSNLASEKVHRAAEKVREAQLAILKAEYELRRYQPETPAKAKHLLNIEQTRDHWSVMATAEIISAYGGARA